jgi:hypothetical protein
MSSRGAAAFWSYAHIDNENDDGAVLRLADLISKQYQVVTGEPLDMFIDTKIGWGEEWERRIKHALIETTFFIPVITPTYLRREECRKELLDFASQAEALGVSELICPIMYSSVAGFSKDSADPAVALAARAQYEDWTELRTEEPSSSPHRKAVEKLVTRLAEVGREVEVRQVVAEATHNDDKEKAGLGELLEQIRQVLAEWTEAAEEDGLLNEKFHAIDAMLEERLRKLKIGPSGARYAVLRKQVTEYQPLLERRGEAVDVMLRKAVELAPLVARAVRILAVHPGDETLLKELSEALRRTSEAYKRREEDAEPIPRWARRHAHETRGMLDIARRSESNTVKRKEAMGLFHEAADEVAELSGRVNAPKQVSAPDGAEAD